MLTQEQASSGPSPSSLSLRASLNTSRHNRRVQVRWVQTDANLGTERGETIICIPVYGGHEHFVCCLRSALAHTPADVRILVCDDASPDTRSQDFVCDLEAVDDSGHELIYLRRQRNLGFPANANGAFAMAAPADVVILNSDCEVAEGWLDGLRDAAYSDSRAATSTALTNHGSLATVPDRGEPDSPEGTDGELIVTC